MKKREMFKDPDSTVEFVFRRWIESGDGHLARFSLETAGGVPVNIEIDNANEAGITAGQTCRVEVYGFGCAPEVYASEADYNRSRHSMDADSLIPTGTFPATSRSGKAESSEILFSGKAQIVETELEAGPDEPNCCITVKALGMVFLLYTRSNENIAPGSIVHGTAFLYGELKQ